MLIPAGQRLKYLIHSSGSLVFELVFFEFSIYTVIKEILGTGADIDLWEILFWIIALLYTYYKFKK